MFKFLKKIKKNKLKKGFTLVETLVALSIFIISVVGIMTVLATGLTNITNAKNKMIATFLAQEGIEYIRNIRDTYVLYDPEGQGTSWSDFLKKYQPICESPKGCYFNIISNLDFWEDYWITKINFYNCGSGVCPLLFYDPTNGKYNNNGNGIKTSFVRKITLSLIENDEIKVTSTVTWGSGNSKSVSFTQNLFNWIE